MPLSREKAKGTSLLPFLDEQPALGDRDRLSTDAHP
jgi:hypothetical protein